MMPERKVPGEEIFREPALKEPSIRRQLGVLPSQLAGIRQFRMFPEEALAIERALIEHARKMSEEAQRER
jgi:hypothetical protein